MYKRYVMQLERKSFIRGKVRKRRQFRKEDFWKGKCMEKIRIENLRSLKDTGQVELKPINVLVGGNSSGKSTFLRFFPLVKQSLGRKINGPILWAGEDDDYVDFGSFDEALNHNSGDGKIKFSFELEVPYVRIFGDDCLGFCSKRMKIKFYLERRVNTELDYVSEIEFKLNKKSASIIFGEMKNVKALYVNGRRYEIAGIERKKDWYEYNRDIFDIPTDEIMKFINKKISNLLFDDNDRKIDYCHEKISVDTIWRYYSEKLDSNDISILEKYKNREIIEEICSRRIDNFTEFEDMVILQEMLSIYHMGASTYLNDYFRNVFYIAPVRATAERYYRLRNSSVDEVDCRGKNLPVFLNSLSESSFNNFRDWTNDSLGFCVEKSLSKGHISLKVRRKNSAKAVNISDAGFGYSQILPIATQLWFIQNEFRVISNGLGETPITIVIEQPELHLHPALQAKLVDVIVSIMKNSKNNIRFIIETHSETIINRLGNLIYKEKLNKDQVNVMIFNKDFGDDDTTIQFGNFDEEGYLENWPAGFFEPEEVQ